MRKRSTVTLPEAVPSIISEPVPASVLCKVSEAPLFIVKSLHVAVPVGEITGAEPLATLVIITSSLVPGMLPSSQFPTVFQSELLAPVQ